MREKLIIDNIKDIMREKGYRFFSSGIYNLNIIGIRSNNSVSDKFDDYMVVCYKDYSHEWHLHVYECTTDPGKHWLLNPMNIKGTLIMKPGQYRSAYKVGKHLRSKPKYTYTALEQVGEMDYVRDNNKDNKLDFSLFDNPDNIITGVFKTNIHRASSWRDMISIGRYSAGCQVFQNPIEFKEFINLCYKQQESGYGDRYTYTLLTMKDFENV